MRNPSTLQAFFLEFWRFDRRAALETLALNVLAALLEGLGLLLLPPLLALAGVLGPASGDGLSLRLPHALAAWLAMIAPGRRLLLTLAVFVALIGLQSLATLLRERRSQQLQLRFVDHLRQTLFGALAASRWNFLCRHHSSEFLSVLTIDLERVGAGTFYLRQLLTAGVLLPVYLGVAFRLSPPVTALALITGALLWAALRRSRAAASRSGVLLSQANQRLYSHVQEFLGALKLIKIHGEEQGYRRQFGAVLAQQRAQQLEFQVVSSRAQMTYRIGAALALAVLTDCALAGLQLPPASLLVLVAIFARMLPQVSQAHLGLQQFAYMAPAFDNWRRWLAACAAEAEAEPEIGATESLRDGIRFRNVSYRHPDSHHRFEAPDVLIPARLTTAVVGPTGSGKTTFLDLLSGLNSPDAGSIEVDGRPLAGHRGWRRQIAYVPQDTAILDGTIRDNLSWGAAGPDEAAMRAALERAALAGVVGRLPDGLDSRVGERGVRLSSGEKQRLALARALLRSPELLILDEATSALDREHQQVILEALRDLHGTMTVLIVTHRFDEIRHLLDGVLRVEAGSMGPWTPVVPAT